MKNIFGNLMGCFFYAMGVCLLQYIPAHLHHDGKPVIPRFSLQEHIYRRCTEEDIEQPFKKINLYEISVNRQGDKKNVLCSPEETLYNIEPNTESYFYTDMIVKVLEIKELDTFSHTYSKKFIESQEANIVQARIELVHVPLDCNYPHSVFRLYYSDQENGELIVTKQNYKTTLGRKGAMRSKLRDKCRTAIAEMMIEQEIWIYPPSRNN